MNSKERRKHHRAKIRMIAELKNEMLGHLSVPQSVQPTLNKPPTDPPPTLIDKALKLFFSLRWKALVAVCAFVCTMWGGWYQYGPEPPHFEPIAPSASPRLNWPFIVNNPNRLFTLYDIRLFCAMHAVMPPKGPVYSGFYPVDSPSFRLEPGEQGTVSCKAGERGVDGAKFIQGMGAEWNIKFAGFNWHRSIVPIYFEWFGNLNPPRWLPGEQEKWKAIFDDFMSDK